MDGTTICLEGSDFFQDTIDSLNSIQDFEIDENNYVNHQILN